jgi:hypothetical protein
LALVLAKLFAGPRRNRINAEAAESAEVAEKRDLAERRRFWHSLVERTASEGHPYKSKNGRKIGRSSVEK